MMLTIRLSSSFQSISQCNLCKYDILATSVNLLVKDSPKVLTTSLIVDFVLLCNVLLTYGTTSNAISITVANMLIYTRDAILATIDLDFFIPDFCFLFSTTFFSVGFSFVFVNDSVFFLPYFLLMSF